MRRATSAPFLILALWFYNMQAVSTQRLQKGQELKCCGVLWCDVLCHLTTSAVTTIVVGEVGEFLFPMVLSRFPTLPMLSTHLLRTYYSLILLAMHLLRTYYACYTTTTHLLRTYYALLWSKCAVNYQVTMLLRTPVCSKLLCTRVT